MRSISALTASTAAWFTVCFSSPTVTVKSGKTNASAPSCTRTAPESAPTPRRSFSSLKSRKQRSAIRSMLSTPSLRLNCAAR